MQGEYVFLKLFDVGRSIDLPGLSRAVQATKGKEGEVLSRKDTPYVSLPRPLVVDIARAGEDDIACPLPACRYMSLQASIYEEGVVTMVARAGFDGLPVTRMHVLREVRVVHAGKEMGVEGWIDACFSSLLGRIEPFLDRGIYSLDPAESLSYKAYCIWDDVGNPRDFLQAHRTYIATFLLGENVLLRLHDDQVTATLANPFSFLQNDTSIFDMERCIIIDPARDYEDILIVVELACYQLLELRVLNRLLDKHMADAELDMRRLLQKRRLTRLGRKVAELARISVDMTFLLSSIENVSTITGDYFLAQVCRHLRDMFRLDEWTGSIRGKLDTLRELYASLKSERGEHTLLYLEIGLAFIFGLEFLLILLDFLR